MAVKKTILFTAVSARGDGIVLWAREAAAVWAQPLLLYAGEPLAVPLMSAFLRAYWARLENID